MMMNGILTLGTMDFVRRVRSPFYIGGAVFGAAALFGVIFVNANGTVGAHGAIGMPAALLTLMYVSVFLNSQLIMTAVAEEKTSRIAELLVSAIDPAHLLAAKVGSSAVLGVLQLAVWITAGVAALVLHAPAGVRETVSPALLAQFVLFFALGYVQASIAFAAAASLVSRTEDVGAISMPLVTPAVLAFIFAAMASRHPSSTLAVATSLLPFTSPFVMFARVAAGPVPQTQLAASLLINAAAIGALAWVGGRFYRFGMLASGRPSFAQLVLAMRERL